ncbi:MAG: S8 family serine peptidase, partial [Bdellovibrionaceae bacterium]|nr:S8 family serine peptidase [Pseudobdellovibrionaceae bacterium]
DIYKNRQYPANFTSPNVLKVASAETDRLDPSRLRTYKLSSWSNFGKANVDILAPGAHISAARLGGGLVVHSGTSMASPYMAHEAARLWMMFPSLTATQVREIFIKSAAPLDEQPLVLSGGIVDFEAAVRTAREMKP